MHISTEFQMNLWLNLKFHPVGFVCGFVIHHWVKLFLASLKQWLIMLLWRSPKTKSWGTEVATDHELKVKKKMAPWCLEGCSPLTATQCLTWGPKSKSKTEVIQRRKGGKMYHNHWKENLSHNKTALEEEDRGANWWCWLSRGHTTSNYTRKCNLTI